MLPAIAILAGCQESLSSLQPVARGLPIDEQPLSTRPSARRLAAIDTAYLAVPQRLAVGQSVEFMLPVASGGCLGTDTTVVTLDQRTATIVPYQQVFTAPDINCPAVYLVERRPVRLRFTTSGEARVRIVSRTGPNGALLTLERAVTVE